MHKSISAAVCLLAISCSNITVNDGNSISNIPDRQAIEEISGLITNMQIDSISIIANDTAAVYYKADSINPYLSSHSILSVYNIYSLKPSNPLYSSKSISVGNWFSDSSHLTNFTNINMYSDSFPFSATIYDTIPIDSLRVFLRYLKDSVLCDTQGCYKVPLDSINAISWYHDLNTTFMVLSQPLSATSGITWGFDWHYGTIKLWARALWMTVDCSRCQCPKIGPM